MPLITQPSHGKNYTAAMAKKVFIGSTLIAGTIIPVNAASLVGTFILYNPPTSGRNVELIRYSVALAGTTTAVIGDIGLVFQTTSAAGVAPTAPTSVTAVTPVNALLNNAASRVLLYSAGTLTGTPTWLMDLGLSFGTTGATPGPMSAVYEFDGSLILPPGSLITTAGVAAQTQAMNQTFVWSEEPL